MSLRLYVIKLLKMIRIPFCRVSGPTSLPNGVSNHRVKDDSTATVTKGLAEISPPSKSTSSSEDGVEPETSKPISEPVAAPASVSLVQNHIQHVTSAQISQTLVNNEPAELQSSTFSRQEPSLFFASRCSSQSDKGMSAFYIYEVLVRLQVALSLFSGHLVKSVMVQQTWSVI